MNNNAIKTIRELIEQAHGSLLNENVRPAYFLEQALTALSQLETTQPNGELVGADLHSLINEAKEDQLTLNKRFNAIAEESGLSPKPPILTNPTT